MPGRPSESLFLDVRGLRYHVRRWPLREIQADAPVDLVGHSLGGNVAALYAGIRPARVAKLVNLEGFGLPRTKPEQAPGRYAQWLDELHERPQLRSYPDFAALEQRLRAGNPRLTAERAHFLARHWGREVDDGSVVLRGDPAHKIVNPQLYRFEEALACWRQVAAPVLWVEGDQTEVIGRMRLDRAQLEERRAAFARVRVATIADSGHMLHHDQPAAVAALIEEFL
jgi:pimeloyl-ACP methyl ester carboxylesterase